MHARESALVVCFLVAVLVKVNVRVPPLCGVQLPPRFVQDLRVCAILVGFDCVLLLSPFPRGYAGLAYSPAQSKSDASLDWSRTYAMNSSSVTCPLWFVSLRAERAKKFRGC